MNEPRLKDIRKKIDKFESGFCDGEKNLIPFLQILSSSLSNSVTVDELLFTIQLLIKDLENGKCGFHNNPNAERKFNELSKKLVIDNNLSVVLSFIPRIINQIADAKFSMEFVDKYKEAVLGVEDIEELSDYGYIEVRENVIDISNKDKAEVLARLYNNSQPMGLGVGHYDPTPLTVEVARQILKKRTNFDYALGRPLKINLEGDIINVGGYNSYNGKGLAQRVISSCKNINDIGQDVLKKVADQFNEEIKKEIEKEIVKKHKEKQLNTINPSLQSRERHTSNLEHLRVSESEMQPIRRLIEETGDNISPETISFIKGIENIAYPEEMKVMQYVDDAEELEDIYNYYLSELTIARNRDWYIIYGEDEDSIEIVDIASLPNRDRESSRREMHNYIVGVINRKALNGEKSVTLNAKEDTSYRMIQRMVSNGEYEILEDETNTWENNDEIVMHNLVLRPIIQRDKDIDEL